MKHHETSSELVNRVIIEQEGTVRIISINRPEVRNAVDGKTANALFKAFQDFDADPTASVAVFTGVGGTFCAGADLKAIALGDPEKAS
jgi:enoyl-CoA hydratase